MSDKYLITVKGTQVVDDEIYTQELTTTASYMEKNGTKLIRYKEYSDDGQGVDYSKSNLLKIEPNKVTLRRKIKDSSECMIFESGVRHQNLHTVGVGSLWLNFFTDLVEDNISENGGELKLHYTIDFNGVFESDNQVVITLKKMEE